MEIKALMEKSLDSGRSAEEILQMALLMQQSMALYEAGIQEICTKLEILKREAQVKGIHNPIDTIKSRVKNVFSVIEKLDRKGFAVSMESAEENLYDVAGVRIICPYIDDIYIVADRIRRQDDLRVLLEKDYIQNPKKNGYRSLHLVVEVPVFLADSKKYVKVEIQLRTIAMDSWASLEHQLRYKKDFEFTEHMANELQICAHLSAELDARMDALRDLVQTGNNV